MTDELTIADLVEVAFVELVERDICIPVIISSSTSRYGSVRWERNKDNSISVLGLELSEFLFNALSDKYEMLGTVYHELAHVLAMVNYGHTGHGVPWKYFCKELGFPDMPRRRRAELDLSKYKYLAYCPMPGCTIKQGYSRLGKILKLNWLSVPDKGYYCSAHEKPIFLKIKKQH